jgi:hypothetical protein
MISAWWLLLVIPAMVVGFMVGVWVFMTNDLA